MGFNFRGSTGERRRRWTLWPARAAIIGGTLALAVWSFAVFASAAGPGDAAAARAHAEAMVKSAVVMVGEGQRGNMGGIADAGRRVVVLGKQAINAIPFPGNQHARDAVEELTAALEQAQQAVIHAEQGREDVAMTHAKKALSRARRGLGHAEAL